MSRLEINALAHPWIHDPVIWHRAEEQRAEQAATAAARARAERYRQQDGVHLSPGDKVICETCGTEREVQTLVTADRETELFISDPNTGRRHHRRNPGPLLPKREIIPLAPTKMLDDKGREVPCERDILTGDLYVFEYDRKGNRRGLLEYIRPGAPS